MFSYGVFLKSEFIIGQQVLHLKQYSTLNRLKAVIIGQGSLRASLRGSNK